MLNQQFTFSFLQEPFVLFLAPLSQANPYQDVCEGSFPSIIQSWPGQAALKQKCTIQRTQIQICFRKTKECQLFDKSITVTNFIKYIAFMYLVYSFWINLSTNNYIRCLRSCRTGKAKKPSPPRNSMLLNDDIFY